MSLFVVVTTAIRPFQVFDTVRVLTKGALAAGLCRDLPRGGPLGRPPAQLPRSHEHLPALVSVLGWRMERFTDLRGGDARI